MIVSTQIIDFDYYCFSMSYIKFAKRKEIVEILQTSKRRNVEGKQIFCCFFQVTLHFVDIVEIMKIFEFISIPFFLVKPMNLSEIPELTRNSLNKPVCH